MDLVAITGGEREASVFVRKGKGTRRQGRGRGVRHRPRVRDGPPLHLPDSTDPEKALARLGVYENEPRVSPGLLGLTNAVFVPHIGSADRDTRETIAGGGVDNILAHLRSDRLPNVVNPEVYAP